MTERPDTPEIEVGFELGANYEERFRAKLSLKEEADRRQIEEDAKVRQYFDQCRQERTQLVEEEVVVVAEEDDPDKEARDKIIQEFNLGSIFEFLRKQRAKKAQGEKKLKEDYHYKKEMELEKKEEMIEDAKLGEYLEQCRKERLQLMEEIRVEEERLKMEEDRLKMEQAREHEARLKKELAREIEDRMMKETLAFEREERLKMEELARENEARVQREEARQREERLKKEELARENEARLKQQEAREREERLKREELARENEARLKPQEAREREERFKKARDEQEERAMEASAMEQVRYGNAKVESWRERNNRSPPCPHNDTIVPILAEGQCGCREARELRRVRKFVFSSKVKMYIKEIQNLKFLQLFFRRSRIFASSRLRRSAGGWLR